MSLWKKIASQFGNPRGLAGNLAGFIMAHRSSNLERNVWAISLLDVQPDDSVLEVGFGPGVAVRTLSELATEGVVMGIDHSPVMLGQATRRNREGIAAGRVKLLLGSVEKPPSLEHPIDKVLDVNSFQFWGEPIESLKELRTRMRPGGWIALAHQPRKPGATDADATVAGEQFAEMLRKAGFEQVRVERKPMKPVSMMCILGRRGSQASV